MSLLVNISTLVANSEIRTEVVEGVEFTILPSKTLPPEIVMKGILYPADEVEAAINTLDGSPVTISHPVINGKFADAYLPIAQAKFGILGAHNKVRGKSADGSWLVDKYIPTEQLTNSANGKRLAEAIKYKTPIHTSTGVYLTKEPEIGVNSMGQDYTFRAKIVRFNHDAILLNEVGAATPEQGVGIFVNASGESEETEVMYVNLSSGDDFSMSSNGMRLKIQEAAQKQFADDDEWLYVEDFNETKAIICHKQKQFAVEYKMVGDEIEFVGELKKVESAGFKFTEVIGRIVDKMISVVKSEPSDESQTVNKNREGNEVDETKVQEMIANALAAKEAEKAQAIKDAVEQGVAAALAANAQTQADAEKAKLVEQVVNAKLLPEDAAKECGVTALKAMLEGNSQGQPAMGLRRGVPSAQDEDIFANYKIEG
ncbi:hypothetical protein D3C79_470670 [compost metagenome]